MALRFILGSAGSGKSYTLNHALVQEALSCPERHFIMIVPEQFTMETQKALTDLHPGHSILNIDIVSFERLAYRVFEELSCMPVTVLDDMGKSLLLRRACAQAEKSLTVFKKQLDKAGFIDQLKSMISELGQYRLEEAELSGLAEQMGKRPLLKQKLEDLKVLYQTFRETMGEGMITAEELFPFLCRVLPRSKQIRGSEVWLDGFTGFTPAQYEVLEKLLTCTDRVTAALTFPYEAAQAGREKDGLYFMSAETIIRLETLAQETGAGREEDLLLSPEISPRFGKRNDLQALSEQLFSYSEAQYAEKPEHIRVIRMSTPGKEAEALAAQIAARVRQKNLRYREIAVVCGDMEGYRPLLEEAFRQAEIPVFMDDKRSLFTNPAVELLRAALEIVEKDFAYEPMFRYMKCGFSMLPEQTLYEMENYVLALGIRGEKRWNSPWEQLYRGGEHVRLEELNEARERIVRPLSELKAAIKKKGASVRDMTEALYRFLGSQNVEVRLKMYAEQFQKEGSYSHAKEYEQAYGQILELFDRIVGLLGEQVLPVRTYKEILETGCREIRVGVIPAAMDRVLVGDVRRSRLKDIRVLFFIGVHDGAIPQSSGGGGLLSERDREELAPYAKLAPSGRESGRIDRFYFYYTVTKPSEELWISYAAADEMGEKRSPSPYLTQLYRIFPLLSEEQGQEEMPVFTKLQALQYLAGGMEDWKRGKTPKDWEELYTCLYADPDTRKELIRLAEGAFFVYRGDRIADTTARLLYGDPLRGSVTRLERYAACAYAQFLSYGLELVKRREFEFAALDMGNVFHKALEIAFREALEHEMPIEELGETDRKLLASYAMTKAAADMGSNILKSSARNKWLEKRMEQITEKTLWALGKQLRAGFFTPAAFELNFASGENRAMRIDLDELGSMQLRGKIDRVDVCEDEEHVYVKVMDYKSGGTDFDLGGVYYGLQMQLVVYLDAVMELEQKLHPDKEIIPAAMFYYQIQDPILDREQAGGDPDSMVLRAMRPKGVFNGASTVARRLDARSLEGESMWIPATYRNGMPDEKHQLTGAQFETLRAFVREQMKTFGKAIASGEISARPYQREERNGCQYCEFKEACGFDRKQEGYRYHRMRRKNPEEIWTEMAEAKEEQNDEVDTEAGTDHRP